MSNQAQSQEASHSGLFRKQSVSRTPTTSILSCLLSSPKTTCSSPDVVSPNDSFSDGEVTSRSATPGSSSRTPPRKSCVSFAAAQPICVANQRASITADKLQDSSKLHNPAPENNRPNEDRRERIPSPIRIPESLSTDIRPVFGSVFDDFEEEKFSPIFLDSYRAGQPKKLVDDCLKKEYELRVSSIRDDQGKDDEDYDVYLSEVEEEDARQDGSEDEAEIRSSLRLDTAGISRCILSPVGVYTPLRDILDNFVPGTLDEDQIDRTEETRRSIPAPRDIDPTYPSEDEEEMDQQTQPSVPFISPVRFMITSKAAPSQVMHITTSHHSNRLNRTHSLPGGGKPYMASQKTLSTKLFERHQPRRGAIAIVQSVEHPIRRHHRRERKDTSSHRITDEEKGIGAVAMAAMAKQLTNTHELALWTLSL